MSKHVLLLLGALCHLSFPAWADPILGTSYTSQLNTRSSGTTVTHFDSSDYVTYSSVDFGNSGTYKGIMLNYSKGNNGGTVEIRLGGPQGDIISEFEPAKTGGWSTFLTAYIGVEDVDGVNDVTFVGKSGSGIFDLASFELSDFADRAAHYSRIEAHEYSNQKGVQFVSNENVGWFDNNDFITYSQINFGSPGTTDGIRLRYSKGNEGGKIEVRLGGPTGTVIAEFTPAQTRGWLEFVDAYIGIDDVSGVHDLTFVGKDANGVLDIDWFELSDFSDRGSHIEAHEYSDQNGIRFVSNNNMGWFDNNDFITYSQINFGTPGTTKGLLLDYSKNNNGGRMEVRLGGHTGTIIAEFSPASTGGWFNFQTAYIGIDDVSGVHDLTFVGKDADGVLDMDYFELSDFSDRGSRIEAHEYSNQGGIRFVANNNVGWFDSNDFITYSGIDFGAPGSTGGIRLNYSKGNEGGRIEVRLGDATGTILAEFIPTRTGGWLDFQSALIPITGVDGMHDITFVGKDANGVLDIDWFELY